MAATHNHQFQKEKLQQHVVIARRKVATLVAFTTTMFLLCLENVKAFTAPISANVILNENTLLFLASGAHSIARRWKAKASSGVEGRWKAIASRDEHIRIRHRAGAVSMSMAMTSNTDSYSYSHSAPVQRSHVSINNGSSKTMTAFAPQPPTTSRVTRNSLTSLRMTFGFGAAPPQTQEPPMLDMKTSINAFGSWYNQMDPVARPPVYDDDVLDYSFSSPADSWPSGIDDTSTSTYISSTAKSAEAKRPRPIRTIRKVAGWVFGSTPARRLRTTQTFL